MDADVLVIGAGASGLAAASELAGRALRVLVLEAKGRVGGRVWTVDRGAGVPTELGAEFIHGPAPETRAWLDGSGALCVSALTEAWGGSAERGGLLHRLAGPRPASNLFANVGDLVADETVESYLERFAADPEMGEQVADVRRLVEGFDAADPAIASVRAVAAERASAVDDYTARPSDGYRTLFDNLESSCDALGVVRLLSTKVQRVSWKRGSVTVEALDEAGSTVVTSARAVVITLPIAVLKQGREDGAVLFDPDLPDEKQRALKYIISGDAVKVVLTFNSAFWEELHGGRYRNATHFLPTNQVFTAFWTQMPVRSKLINAWAGGPRATRLSRLSSAEVIDRAVETFGAMLGEAMLTRREFNGGITHNWRDDPFARGAYSYLAVGAGNARATLAAPIENTLFFAGEATAINGEWATVEGALRTGKRAGREAADCLLDGGDR